MSFPELDRPARNRRRLNDKQLNYDQDIEDALLTTISTGKAIQIPIHRFHSSPAKGRLWTQGYKVHHRVLSDRYFVAAWIDVELSA